MSEAIQPTGTDIGFAITADSGTLGQRALLLARSLRDHYPRSRILTFIPKASIPEMEESLLSEFRSETTVETGPFPIPEYPYSAFQAALCRCTERFDDAHYYAALDSDAVLLNRLTLPRLNADVYATRMYMGGWEWQAIDGIRDDWYSLFEHYDITPPSRITCGVVDRYPMWPPYYNCGVIVTTDPEFPQRFVRTTNEIYNEEITATHPGLEAEQVAFALLAADKGMDVVELSAKQNWMMGGFLRVPDDVEVLHYQFLDTLATLRNRRHQNLLNDYGATLDPRVSDYLARVLSYAVFHGGRVFRHRYYERFSAVLQRYLDWNNPES